MIYSRTILRTYASSRYSWIICPKKFVLTRVIQFPLTTSCCIRLVNRLTWKPWNVKLVYDVNALSGVSLFGDSFSLSKCCFFGNWFLTDV